MQRVWYLLAGIFGLFGVLTVARIIERFINGEEWAPGQSLIAVFSLLFAFICFGRARAVKK